MTKEAKGSNPGYSTIMILTLGKLFMQLTSMQYIYTGEIVTELHGWWSNQEYDSTDYGRPME